MTDYPNQSSFDDLPPETHTEVEAVMVDSEGNHISNGKILKVNRHSGIGPTHEGVPSALRSTVEDTKSWYKTLFNSTRQQSMASYNTDENDNSVEDFGTLSSHSSMHTDRPPRIGSIFDYQPRDEYVVENKPKNQQVNKPVPPPTNNFTKLSINGNTKNRNSYHSSLSSPRLTSYNSTSSTNDGLSSRRSSAYQPLNSAGLPYQEQQPRYNREKTKLSNTSRAASSSSNRNYDVTKRNSFDVTKRNSFDVTKANSFDHNNDVTMKSNTLQLPQNGIRTNSTTSSIASEVEKMFPTSEEVRKWTTMFDDTTFHLPPEKVPLTEKKAPDIQAVNRNTSTSSGASNDVFLRKQASSSTNNSRPTSTYSEVFPPNANSMAGKIQQQESPNTPAIYGKVKFSFDGKTNRELRLQKGEKVQVLHKKNESWYTAVDSSGNKGLVPINYINLISEDVHSPGSATAKFDFRGSTNREMQMSKGDEIVLMKKVDNNWYKAKTPSGDRSGIVPASYIQVNREPKTSPKPKPTVPEQPPSGNRSVTSSKSVTSSVASSGSPRINDVIITSESEDPEESVRKQKASLLANSVVSSNTKLRSASDEKAPVKYEFDMSFMEQVATEELGSPRDETEQVVDEQVEQEDESYEKGEKFVAVYEYKPPSGSEDELHLNVGDVTVVVEKCDDGWFVGTNQNTGLFGTFPGNFVQPMTS